MDAGVPAVLAQIDAVLAEVDRLGSNSGDWQTEEGASARTRCVATLRRLAPKGAGYADIVDRAELKAQHWDHLEVARAAAGALRALRADFEAGYLTSLTELVHGDLFADFLEMSEHLLNEGYKDAAAVIAGSTLEGHLRALAEKSGLPTTSQGGDPLTASRLTNDLRGNEVFGKGDQKSVTACLDIRNNAAHGDYDRYEAGQVGLLISGVRDFVRRLPA